MNHLKVYLIPFGTPLKLTLTDGKKTPSHLNNVGSKFR
nr:MAG TPA: hypothetical protein [Caudoviricetes sp.]